MEKFQDCDNYEILKEHVSEIIEDKLYLGDSRGRSQGLLEDMKIDLVVCACNIRMRKYDDFEFVTYDLADSSSENIIQYFDDFYEKVQSAFSKNQRVYVHCFAGISRSAALVISYIMKSRKLCYKDALEFVRSKRKIVSPNRGFIQQLKQYEKDLGLERKKGFTALLRFFLVFVGLLILFYMQKWIYDNTKKV